MQVSKTFLAIDSSHTHTHTHQVLPMAMAQVFIPNPHDSIPPLHRHIHTPSLLTSPSPSITTLPEEDQTSILPPAPPPSPEMQPRRFGPIFEIDPRRFETPRKSELPPSSPTNSLDFSTLFTPNKSPLESEPHSPTHVSPGDPLDSAHCSSHYSSSQLSNAGSSSLSIPISPNSITNSCYSSKLSHCHSEGDTFSEMRSQTALAQHPNVGSNYHSTDSASPAPRPRSHTHPSHSLTPHTTYTHEQRRRQEVRTFHPHLPLSFEATQLQSHASPDGQISDSGYHEADSPVPRKKLNLKRKSDELGYENDLTETAFSCDSYSTSACSSESEWLVIHPKGNKKACQEGENPVIRRQSASFSGALTITTTGFSRPFADGTNTFSAPPTPNHPTTPLSQDLCGVRNSSLSPTVFPNHQGTSPLPVTPTPSAVAAVAPSSLQSMDIAEETAMDSMDSMECGMGMGDQADHCVEMDSLSNTLRGSHLEHTFNTHNGFFSSPSPPHKLLQVATLSTPQPSVISSRSYSLRDGYDFSQEPQLANIYCFSSYHEGAEGGFSSMGSPESTFLLSKSL